ncbi:MAG TPA: hypothetical protein DIC53_07775 [Synergistaceae bacterium]|jgi:hypothetical protein|nr:hypothetical protein [Synergistaceae bacterium]
MGQKLRKGFVALLLFSAAGFLFLTLGESSRVESLRYSTHSGRVTAQNQDGIWHAHPDMLTLVQRVHDGLANAVRPVADAGRDMTDTAEMLMARTMDGIEELARFIQSQNPSVSMDSALCQAAAFLKYSLKYDAPLDLLVAVAHTESRFASDARSKAGAAGVMQVMWRVHSGLLTANGITSEEDLHDPEMGIAAGSLLLSRYLRTYGDTQTALGRYYGGSASVYWSRVSRSLSKVRALDLLATLF